MSIKLKYEKASIPEAGEDVVQCIDEFSIIVAIELALFKPIKLDSHGCAPVWQAVDAVCVVATETKQQLKISYHQLSTLQSDWATHPTSLPI